MKEVWLEVDKNGSEFWYSLVPEREDGYWASPIGEYSAFERLFPGAIKILTGKELTWNDEPIKIEL